MWNNINQIICRNRVRYDSKEVVSLQQGDKINGESHFGSFGEEKKDDGSRHNNDNDGGITSSSLRLQEIKEQEAQLLSQLRSVRRVKLQTLRARPLSVGVVGFGRFGQFIAQSFTKHADRVVATSRGEYSDVARAMGVHYVRDDLEAFLAVDPPLDVIVLAVSITSFEPTVRKLVPYLKGNELLVDVLSVKEHPRQVFLDLLPPGCDVLCTHPMFGPDSGAAGWRGLNFVYERTRINGVIQQHTDPDAVATELNTGTKKDDELLDDVSGGIERAERFLSIWEEEGCRMVSMSCQEHDEFAANSQFVTHLMGRILGAQGLVRTPIDTKGFESVLKLIGTTTADSFDLFYGLYKYNINSAATIRKLQQSLTDVVNDLEEMEKSKGKNEQKGLFQCRNDERKRSA